jgi:hypothetical protein
LGNIGAAFLTPAPVQTLDEIVLIIRRSSGLRFDERLSHFHFYGADICLSAAERGMRSYVIPAFCIHNTQMNFILPQEFYRSYAEFKKIWTKCLPIQTTCIKITRFNLPLYNRRMLELCLAFLGRKQRASRLDDVKPLLKLFEAASPESTL